MAGFLPNQLTNIAIKPSDNDVFLVQQSGSSVVSHVTYVDLISKGVANGICPLDANNLIPSLHLPSYVDDVLEFTNLASFPTTGEIGKIYVALDTNKTYRWGGTSYVYITSGAVDSVAGKTGVVTLVTADITDIQPILDSKINSTQIGVTVQPYDVNTVVDANYVHTDVNYTTIDKTKVDLISVTSAINLDIAVLDTDIGVTVQPYDVNTVVDANYSTTVSTINSGGTTASRPVSPVLFQNYFDTTISKPIWFDGTNWVDSTGAIV